MGIHDYPAGWHKGKDTAKEIWVDTDNFVGSLGADHYTVQKALEALDNPTDGDFGFWTRTGNELSPRNSSDDIVLTQGQKIVFDG